MCYSAAVLGRCGSNDMKEQQRVIVAEISAAMINGLEYNSIYDHTAAKWIKAHARATDTRVDAYDYQRSNYVSGDLPGAVYDYDLRTFLQFTPTGKGVNGYDYGTRTFFEASVSGKAVSLYDHEDGRWYAFEVG
jgi:hypothetical protein